MNLIDRQFVVNVSLERPGSILLASINGQRGLVISDTLSCILKVNSVRSRQASFILLTA